MKRAGAASHPVRIYIAGDAAEAARACRAYCDEIGYCVTVTPTQYVYTGGQVPGVIVGLINYPRFPAAAAEIDAHAERLGLQLLEQLGQDSFSIEGPQETRWYSRRPEDLAP